jgi:flagellar hook-associated protein 3 FlgL
MMALNRIGLERTVEQKRQEQARLLSEMATGLRVQRASDDAAAFGKARRMEGLAQRYEQYQQSIDDANAWTDHTQATLDDLAGLFTQAYEEGIQALNDTASTDDREALASTIESLIAPVIDLLNAKDGDEYLFAGTNTTVRPFVQDSAAGSDAAGVSYYGNAFDRTRAVGPGTTLAVGIPGSRVFDPGAGYTLTDSLRELADALRTGDTTQMQTTLDQVIVARDHLLHLGTEAGTLANRLDTTYDYLDQALLETEEQRTHAEDADLTETILNLEKNQTGLQAALQALATVQQQTLLDYLR